VAIFGKRGGFYALHVGVLEFGGVSMMQARNMESLEIGMGRSHAGYQTVGMHLSGSHRHGCWRFGAIVCAVLLVALISAVKITPSAIIAEDTGYYFLSIGDFGTAEEAQFSVAKQMGETAAAHQVEFVVGVGDNFYMAGVSGVDDTQIREKFEDVYTHPALQIPWYMSLGDHDQRGSVAAEVAYTNVSKRWQMPSPYFVKHITSKDGQHTLDIIFTDSVGLEGAILQVGETRRFQEDYNETFAGAEAGHTQMQWLEQVLNQSTADWKICVGHRPLFSCAHRSRMPVEERLHEKLMPMFQKYGLDVYLHGHDHIGQHSVRGGIVHIGNGVGGFDTHSASADQETVWFNNTYHGFILHHVTATKLEFRFMDEHGSLLHTAIVTKEDVS
jgi:hypothetical protein